MKLLSETLVEINYFEMVGAIENYLAKTLGGGVEVSWVSSSQDFVQGIIPYHGSYKVKIKGDEVPK